MGYGLRRSGENSNKTSYKNIDRELEDIKKLMRELDNDTRSMIEKYNNKYKEVNDLCVRSDKNIEITLTIKTLKD